MVLPVSALFLLVQNVPQKIIPSVKKQLVQFERVRKKISQLTEPECQESETGFSLDKQLVTPYRTSHTDELNAHFSGVCDQILSTPLPKKLATR